MKKLTETFTEKKTTFSFELFPPRTEEGYQKLFGTIDSLASLNPDYISVTYGAGGGSREGTIRIVDYIQKKHNIIGVAHLTCIANTKDEIKAILDDIKGHGITNVLALRGDPPLDNPNWSPTEKHFKFSYELCGFIRKNYGDYFGIGVAGFPEGHILCPDKNLDTKYLKMKIDNGADYVVTQLFFNNEDYFDYVARLRKLGIKNRIVPGILPITDYTGTVKFCQKCGTTIPQNVHKIFSPIQNDKEKTLKAGIQFATKQCEELLAKGAPGIHFYPLNKFHPVDSILQAIRK